MNERFEHLIAQAQTGAGTEWLSEAEPQRKHRDLLRPLRRGVIAATASMPESCLRRHLVASVALSIFVPVPATAGTGLLPYNPFYLKPRRKARGGSASTALARPDIDGPTLHWSANQNSRGNCAMAMALTSIGVSSRYVPVFTALLPPPTSSCVWPRISRRVTSCTSVLCIKVLFT